MAFGAVDHDRRVTQVHAVFHIPLHRHILKDAADGVTVLTRNDVHEFNGIFWQKERNLFHVDLNVVKIFRVHAG